MIIYSDDINSEIKYKSGSREQNYNIWHKQSVQQTSATALSEENKKFLRRLGFKVRKN